MAEVDFSAGAVPITRAVSDNMVHGVQYAHYLRSSATQPFPSFYEHLLSLATTRVIIWDPYFHDADTAIFRGLNAPVDVTVLSSKSASQKDSYLNKLFTETPNHLKASLTGNCTFSFGFIDKGRHGAEVWNTHDRYLIIDNDYYLVGASVAHHLAAHGSTGICKLMEHADKDIVQQAFDKCWQICVHDSMYKTQTL